MSKNIRSISNFSLLLKIEDIYEFQTNEMESNTYRDLVCVKFPGIVKNDDKAIQCLGGLKSISNVYSNSKKRLGLSFQPDNPYVKQIFADSQNAAGLLLKVKVKKRKVNNEIKREVLSTSIVGRVNVIYRFESLCDFQYLPIETNKSPPQCLLEHLLPSGLDSFHFLMEPSPIFIIPPHFTRSDKPIPYLYTYKKYGRDMHESDDVHSKIRSDRKGIPSNRFTFNLIDELSAEPHEFYLKQKEERLKVYPNIIEEYNTVKKFFEERPIVSMNLLKYETKLKTMSLKVILPCLAINFHGGPWKMLWVRFGYDPRKDPGARFYQTLDFRLRNTPGLQSLVLTRVATINKHKKEDRCRSLKRSITGDEATTSEEVTEGAVYFRKGLVPSQRQIYYQYCDIKIPEVQELLASDPPPGYLCHPKRGWLRPSADEICRDHIYTYVKESLVSTLHADLKLERGGSSDEESDEESASAAPEAEEMNESL